MFEKILVAIDRSEVSDQAFEVALSLAKVHNAQIMLAHVLSPQEEGYPTPVFPLDSSYPSLQMEAVTVQMQALQMLEQEGIKFLRTQADRAKAAGVPTEFTQPLGNPGRTICMLARDWGAQLILMGRRGHSGLNEWFLGSVSNYVLHHAPCSVLIVQGEVKPDLSAPPESQEMGAESA